MWLSKIGDSISRSMIMGINVGSEKWSKLSNDTGVNIKSKMKIESQGWGLGSHSHSSSISLNEKTWQFVQGLKLVKFKFVW